MNFNLKNPLISISTCTIGFQRKDHHTSIDLDLFYTHFSNKIVPNYNTDPTKIIYNNLEGYSISKGASFQINQSFSIPLNISLGGTYLDVYTINEGDKNIELFTPSFSGVFSLLDMNGH